MGAHKQLGGWYIYIYLPGCEKRSQPECNAAVLSLSRLYSLQIFWIWGWRGLCMGRECDFFSVLTLRIFFSERLLQAYRLEPLILKHYSNISPVQIHWYNTANPVPYEHMKPSFLNPTKEPTSVTDSESASTGPSPTTSPVMVRRHYGESITNIGKASILGNCYLCPFFLI